MKSASKIVFWMIILVFVFSSFLAYSSISLSPQNIGQDNRVVVTPEEKQAIEDEKTAQTLGEGIEGTVKKFSDEEAKTKEATHYLEVDGVVLVLLEGIEGVDLNQYTDKNVKVWGEISQTLQEQQMLMKVKKVEAR